jgi:HlyD family secretion protein
MSTQKTGAAPGRSLGVMRHMIFTSVVMGVLCVGVVGWAGQAKLSGAIIAQGSVVVDRNVKKVQHSLGGIVAEIAVRNGDVVREGDLLLRLDATQIKAEIGVIRAQLIELHARGARLSAERDGRTHMTFPAMLAPFGEEGALAFKEEERLFREAAQSRESQKHQLRLRIEQIKEEIGGVTAQRSAKEGELSLIHRELLDVRALNQKGLTPVTRVYALERDAQRLGGDHGGLVAQIARAKGQISEIEVQLLGLDENHRAQAQRELRALDSKVGELTERDVAARDKLTRIDIRAPQSGVVHELAFHTVNGVVAPAEQIMLIVPSEDRLTIQARLLPTDIDQVALGQSARIILSAYNRQTTPELVGRLIHVSADTTLDAKTGQTFYLARLDISDTSRLAGTDVKILPGMPIEVFIATGERTAMSYLLKPLTDQMNRAFRE